MDAKCCRHRENRRKTDGKRHRRDRGGDIVDEELSKVSFMAGPDVKEEPQADWLNNYLDKSKIEVRELYVAKSGSQLQDKKENPSQLKTNTVRSNRSETRNSSRYSQRSDIYDGRNEPNIFPQLIKGATAFKKFLVEHPLVAKILAALIVGYIALWIIESWTPILIADGSRIFKPWARWIALHVQFLGRRIFNWGQMLDDMIEAWFCDLSSEWCERFHLMCDVRCSFMDNSLQRAQMP